MINMNGLELINYCYPGCTPLLNIMRLPKEKAFELAYKLAFEHPNTTAFGRFADFENYYILRKKQDDFLYNKFCELGGKPEEKHPLSFTIGTSDYLKEWFGNGIETRLKLRDILPEHISFTACDSGAFFNRNDYIDVLTYDDLTKRLESYVSLKDFLEESNIQYIEAQLWSDRYIK